MRRILPALLLSTLTLLPAFDLVSCPDGCSDADRAAYGWAPDGCGTHGECGLCLNAVAVHGVIAQLDPRSARVALSAAPATILMSLPPRCVDRPPRRS